MSHFTTSFICYNKTNMCKSKIYSNSIHTIVFKFKSANVLEKLIQERWIHEWMDRNIHGWMDGQIYRPCVCVECCIDYIFILIVF